MIQAFLPFKIINMYYVKVNILVKDEQRNKSTEVHRNMQEKGRKKMYNNLSIQNI